jgi:methionine-rich copper-binding protein CopC
MNRQVVRGVAVAVLAAVALLLGAAPALAHARLLNSDPADGASLDAGPQRVSLTFSDAMTGEFDAITIVGPDEKQYQTGDVSAEGNTVSIAVQPLGPAGLYDIGYRVVSADGHPVEGSLSFTLTTPGPAAATTNTAPAQAPAATPAPAAAPAAPDNDSGGMPLWPWLVGAIVLIGAGVVVALRLGKTSAR